MKKEAISLLIALAAALVPTSPAEAEIAFVEPAFPHARRIAPPPMSRGPLLVSDQLSSNRGASMPTDRVQLVVFYDGASHARPALRLQCADARTGEAHWFGVDGVRRSDQHGRGRIETAEFIMNGCTPTGVVHVSGVVPDGVIDGVAFGLLYRDARGAFHTLRSQSARPSHLPRVVGMWPLAMSDDAFAMQTPQLRDGDARAQARAVLFGAEYLDNGQHAMRLPASWSAPIVAPAVIPPVRVVVPPRR